MIEKIIFLLQDYLLFAYNKYDSNKFQSIKKILEIFIKNNINVDFERNIVFNLEDIQSKFSLLFEENKNNKELGAFYTPIDIVTFINNSIFNFDVLKKNKAKSLKSKINTLSVFDPTCGNSEFLLNMYIYKKNLLIKFQDEKIIEIISSIYGNDLNQVAILISKIRLFIQVVDDLDLIENIKKAFSIINKNFSNYNFVTEYNKISKEFDIIIGNPPYVESKKVPQKIKYGNLYAEIIENSIKLLKNNGKLGFIIPISFISTPRMNKIRDFVLKNSSEIILLNYSDRPSSLFFSVHQKLSILFIEKNITKDFKLYTSNYQYWYKNERERLFSDFNIIENKYINSDYIPKIGNHIEKKIYEKIKFEDNTLSIYDYLFEKNGKIMFLNMRVGFWIKIFKDFARSKEYKEFTINEKYYYYFYLIFNSSLFFLYWTIISDCWHITTKELKNFKIILPDLKYHNKIKKLSNELENKLEETKKYIGSKQIDYEYKHKMCKKEINNIDVLIGKIYNFTDEEIEYIKNFAIKYRESRG